VRINGQHFEMCYVGELLSRLAAHTR